MDCLFNITFTPHHPQAPRGFLQTTVDAQNKAGKLPFLPSKE